MAQKLLDSANIVARFQQMGSEAVAKAMASGAFNQAGLSAGLGDGPADRGFMSMMAAAPTAARVHGKNGRREHPLPAPLFARLRQASRT